MIPYYAHHSPDQSYHQGETADNEVCRIPQPQPSILLYTRNKSYIPPAGDRVVLRLSSCFYSPPQAGGPT